jgi:hypothetical protein
VISLSDFYCDFTHFNCVYTASILQETECIYSLKEEELGSDIVTHLYKYLYYKILNTWPSGMLLNFMLRDHTNGHSRSISHLYLESICFLILVFTRCFSQMW